VLVKLDYIEGMERVYTQVQGKDRAVVEEVGRRLGLEGSYIPHSYIELVQIGHLTEVGGDTEGGGGGTAESRAAKGVLLGGRVSNPGGRSTQRRCLAPPARAVLPNGHRGPQAALCSQWRAADR
jgi:hypothetical protein